MTLQDRNTVDALAMRVGHVAAIATLLTESRVATEDGPLGMTFDAIAEMLMDVKRKLNEVTDSYSGNVS